MMLPSRGRKAQVSMDSPEHESVGRKGNFV